MACKISHSKHLLIAFICVFPRKGAVLKGITVGIQYTEPVYGVPYMDTLRLLYRKTALKKRGGERLQHRWKTSAVLHYILHFVFKFVFTPNSSK